MLHGWTERAEEYAGLVGDWRDHWAEEAERECFMVAWPQGVTTELGPGSHRMWSSWNAGCSRVPDERCNTGLLETGVGRGGYCSSTCDTCDTCAWCACVDDVGFLVHLTRHLVSSPSLALDASRVFVAGCSNGGMMAYELLMRAPVGLYAAFVINCGLPQVGHLCAPPSLVPILQIHATNDETIPIDGTPATDGGYRFESLDRVFAALEPLGVAGGQCVAAEPKGWTHLASEARGVPTAGPELRWLRGLPSLPHAERDGARCSLKADCGDGAALALCTGTFGHDWPAWTAAIAWRFLSQYRVPTLSAQGVHAHVHNVVSREELPRCPAFQPLSPAQMSSDVASTPLASLPQSLPAIVSTANWTGCAVAAAAAKPRRAALAPILLLLTSLALLLLASLLLRLRRNRHIARSSIAVGRARVEMAAVYPHAEEAHGGTEPPGPAGAEQELALESLNDAAKAAADAKSTVASGSKL